MPRTFTNPPPPQPATGSCTSCQFFFMPTAQSESDDKWLSAFKVATFLILFYTVIPCLSKLWSKFFGYICSGGRPLSGGSSPGTNNICSDGHALTGFSSPGTNNVCNVCSDGQALTDFSSPGTNNICSGSSLDTNNVSSPGTNYEFNLTA